MKNLTTQLGEVKENISPIQQVIESLQKVWPSNKFTMIGVLVQNLAFHSPDAQNYTEIGEMEEAENIIQALKELAELDKNDHTTNWIYEEIRGIWDGYWMNEEMDINPEYI